MKPPASSPPRLTGYRDNARHRTVLHRGRRRSTTRKRGAELRNRPGTTALGAEPRETVFAGRGRSPPVLGGELSSHSLRLERLQRLDQQASRYHNGRFAVAGSFFNYGCIEQRACGRSHDNDRVLACFHNRRAAAPATAATCCQDFETCPACAYPHKIVADK